MLFHHIFLQLSNLLRVSVQSWSLVDSILSTLNNKECYSTYTSTSGSGRSVNYVGFPYYALDLSLAEHLAEEFRLLYVLLSAISCKPQLVCCTGGSLDFLKLVIDCPLFFTHRVQCIARFNELSVAKLMHKQSYSVFGRIDISSVVQHLIIFLGGSLQYEGTLLASELSKVGIYIYIPNGFRSKSLAGPNPLLSQAIKACKFDVVNLPTICHELLINWTEVIDYLTKYAMTQEMQGVKKLVSSKFPSY